MPHTYPVLISDIFPLLTFFNRKHIEFLCDDFDLCCDFSAVAQNGANNERHHGRKVSWYFCRAHVESKKDDKKYAITVR